MTTHPTASDQSRAKFEVWAEPILALARDGDEYVDPYTQTVWEAWQVALSVGAASAPSEASLNSLLAAFSAYRDNPTAEAWKPVETLLAALLGVQPEPSEPESGTEMAARFVERRLLDYDAEHGGTDPDTGTREYPGNGDEYVSELQEIADGIRALKGPK